jgi:hypothetical protein
VLQRTLTFKKVCHHHTSLPCIILEVPTAYAERRPRPFAALWCSVDAVEPLQKSANAANGSESPAAS